ncbi:MAG TPA: leucyl/phenylalanyl-tRNA--protein transferase [Acidimicrobiales bacterium]|nr:leucyl/phenylalanyl-tRNA--protein transferase [Acidimicrobiales bacterium]
MSAPIDLPPPRWQFPTAERADRHGVVCVGADLEPATVIAAYRRGLFPMPIGGRRFRRLAWWSPDPRGVLPIDALRVTRSLRRSRRRFDVRIDTAFEAVIDACADPHRSGAWITPDIRAAYVELHRRGWAHSVEAFDIDSGELTGGLYGLAIGGLFAGESMFHRATDASKVALVHLVEVLRDDGHDGAGRLVDVQWATPHLTTLGVIEIPRPEYLTRLATALALPLPSRFTGTNGDASPP